MVYLFMEEMTNDPGKPLEFVDRGAKAEYKKPVQVTPRIYTFRE